MIERWKSRLALGESWASSESPRLRWLGRVYVRLYRFLLVRFAGVSGNEPLASNETVGLLEQDEVSQMPFVDHTANEPGKPAKSLAQMQATLTRIQAVAPQQTPGDFAGGLGTSDWIVVASSRSRYVPERCEKLLQLHKIACQLWEAAAEVSLVVRVADKERAMNLIRSHEEILRRKPGRKSLFRRRPRREDLVTYIVHQTPEKLSPSEGPVVIKKLDE